MAASLEYQVEGQWQSGPVPRQGVNLGKHPLQVNAAGFSHGRARARRIAN